MDIEKLQQILSKHEQLIRNASDKDLDDMIDEISSLLNERIDNISKENVETLLQQINNIIKEVEISKTEILSKLSEIESKKKATKSYLNNQYPEGK